MLYFTKFTKPRMANNGDQNMLLHKVLLWHTGYLELKAPEKEQGQEGFSDFLLFHLNTGQTFPMRKLLSMQQKGNILITQDSGLMPR